MDSEYLYHLIFTLFKFIFKNFLFLEIVFDTMMLMNIFLNLMDSLLNTRLSLILNHNSS